MGFMAGAAGSVPQVRQRDAVLEKQMLSCLSGQLQSPFRPDFVCHSLQAEFFMQVMLVAVLSMHTWKGNQWELYAECIKCCKLANSFGKCKP